MKRFQKEVEFMTKMYKKLQNDRYFKSSNFSLSLNNLIK